MVILSPIIFLLVSVGGLVCISSENKKAFLDLGLILLWEETFRFGGVFLDGSFLSHFSIMKKAP